MNEDIFALLKIIPEDGGEGEAIPIGCGNIVSYKGRIFDVNGDGEGISEDGYTIRDVRRRDKSRLSVRFDNLTTAEFKTLINAISHNKFQLMFFCGEYKTITAHTGDRNFELIKAVDETEGRWRLDVNFIEY